MTIKPYNVLVTVVHIVRADSAEAAIKRLTQILEAEGFYTWDEVPEAGGSHAFEDEDPNAAETLPDRWL